METVGTNKAKRKFTLEEWKKEANAARTRAAYWKNKFEDFQCNIEGEMDVIDKEMERVKLNLKWAHDANKQLKEEISDRDGRLKFTHDANKELKASNIDLKGANDELAADGSKYRLDIKLLQEDLDIEKQFNERLQDDHNVLKNIQRHTALLGWAGWILFFIALFGMIFFKN